MHILSTQVGVWSRKRERGKGRGKRRGMRGRVELIIFNE
jgi:hypothetical protein